MRISDWSSDVCSSDLVPHAAFLEHRQPEQELRALAHAGDDKLIDGALVRIGEVAARERVRLVEGDMLDRANLVRRQRGEIEARAVALERSEEQTSDLQSLMRRSYAVFCLNNKKYII